MILTFFAFFLKVFATIISGIGTLFTLPYHIYDTIGIIIEKMLLFNEILPVSDILKVLSMLIGFEIVFFIIRIVISVVNWIRGAGGISLDI